MADIEKIRKMRDKIRQSIGFRDGVQITDDMLSATMAALSEVWTLRIWLSPVRHVDGIKDPGELMRIVSDRIAKELMEQGKKYLPHSRTFSLFKEPDEEGS